MVKTENLKSEWERLVAAHSFVLACHQRPDGDALGSALALAHVLRTLGKNVLVLSEDGVPDNYKFIPESDTVLRSTERRDLDVGVLVDCEGPKRVGSAAEVVTGARTTACVDHHVPNGGFGDIRLIDSSRASTAELLVDVFTENDIPIDSTCAVQLMTGLIADTGAFRFPNTTTHTFESAARLTALGADPSIIVREVYERRPMRAVRLLGKALDSIVTDDDCLVAWATITLADLAEVGATDQDTESVVNFVGLLDGPEVYMLFRESEPDSIRVSLRSKGEVDVNAAAKAFGGGGHVAAAGCTVSSALAEAQKMVVAEVLRRAREVSSAGQDVS